MMRAISCSFLLTLVIAVIVLTAIGCLMVVDVIGMEAGKDLPFKSLAAILLLGVASAAVALLIRERKRSDG